MAFQIDGHVDAGFRDTVTARPGAARRGGVRIVILAVATIAVAGCSDDSGSSLFSLADDGSTATRAARSTKLVERDVEAPDVFQVSEAGLWDGRPSLGGVWVAHPNVSEPERVLIRNMSNDSFVIGALFRRELENPGPRLQVSSDAAAALGMLAGAPVELNVTALRRETSGDETPAPVAAAPSAGSLTAPAAVTTAALGPAAATSSAIAPAPAAPARAEQKPGLLQRLGLKKAAPVEAPRVEAAVIATPPAAPAPAPEPEVQPRTAAPIAEPATPVSTLAKPYVQIGIFSVEANARSTAAAMGQNGIVPLVREHKGGDKDFYRVLLGPAADAQQLDRLMDTAREAGFTDAYAVTN